MDAIVRGLSRQLFDQFRTREFDGEFTGKHSERTKAHSMELTRASRVWARLDAKDDGNNFPKIKDQWVDDPKTYVEIQDQPLNTINSLPEIGVPFTEVLERVHESYYLRNLWRWNFVMGRDAVYNLQYPEIQHGEVAETQEAIDFIESLFSKSFFSGYIRD